MTLGEAKRARDLLDKIESLEKAREDLNKYLEAGVMEIQINISTHTNEYQASCHKPFSFTEYAKANANQIVEYIVDGLSKDITQLYGML